MRFRMGGHLRLAQEDLLRHFRLRGSGDPLRRGVRYDCGFMVFRSANLRTADWQGALLPYQSQGDHEEDT